MLRVPAACGAVQSRDRARLLPAYTDRRTVWHTSHFPDSLNKFELGILSYANNLYTGIVSL